MSQTTPIIDFGLDFSREVWTLLNENGSTAIEFTSFISIDYRNEGQAVAYPIEEGSFVNYNKTANPLNIIVTLAVSGRNDQLEQILVRLDEYQSQAIKLSVSTPVALYESMTLESYSYTRTQERNSDMLTVELSLVEVRDITTQVTTIISKPRNATSSSKENTGRKQPNAQTALSEITNKIISGIGG